MKNALDYSKKHGIAIITILLFIMLALTTEGFFTERNLRNILDQQSTILIAASFMTIVIISGNFDISVSSIFVVSPLFALLVENATGNIFLALIAVTILLSPYYRSSAYWGLEENYAIIFSLISLLSLEYFLQNNKIRVSYTYLLILVISVSSSACVYFDLKFLIMLSFSSLLR